MYVIFLKFLTAVPESDLIQPVIDILFLPLINQIKNDDTFLIEKLLGEIIGDNHLTSAIILIVLNCEIFEGFQNGLTLADKILFIGITLFDFNFQFFFGVIFVIGLFCFFGGILQQFWQRYFIFFLDVRDFHYLAAEDLFTILVLNEEFHVFGSIIIFSDPILIISDELTHIVAPVFFVYSPLSVLHVVLESSSIALPIFIEVDTLPMFFILIPISDVELSFIVVVLSLTVLHAVEELALVALFIGIDESAPAIKFCIKHGARVEGTIGHFQLLNLMVLTGLWQRRLALFLIHTMADMFA